MEQIKLSNGVQIPRLGLGTFMVRPEDTKAAVYTAIKDGYRLIDTANGYNNEKEVGEGIQQAINDNIVKREDIFLSTKIWPTFYENVNAVDETLKRLGVDYVDLLFIHQPSGNFVAGYQLIEKAYHDGKAKSLGISNMHDEKLDKLLSKAEVKPHVIQLEAHPYDTEDEIMGKLSQYDTKLMGWYPLGHGDSELFKEPTFVALADKYHKSVPQVILRWHIQMGFITIPGSKNPDHIRDNFNIFDFSLTDAEMKEISKLDGTKKYYQPDNATEEKYAEMHLPFEK
ncbi:MULTISPECIES: aldo/keto reductase [Lactiplantibacillus]|jgi:diketogulonate reductase-like aldo/keto reductase|uniref:Aldo/keto reductase n=1 Tax=Lactiplantibacillus pentosus TaxID=1589 RepID=A0A2K9I8H9_LACPE|nr:MULTISPECIES: aldo/keto reductase [Lactiplantibacillus]AUI78059.1 oxidoreductase [Lactiplantibacillus pentosus]MBU7459924.1 aldo/keto reductase [Lactiplantibacillus pentosus]MBU7465296.1 aldo/keto reductase [Lactiplantibacillus pentosus]MBU7478773.1 aldo/keto reductase [Lactiplantibacillus pentosus]MBU7482625.1 aldo/keto reductase [Lactiplantibacillus sp. 30.2.29]